MKFLLVFLCAGAALNAQAISNGVNISNGAALGYIASTAPAVVSGWPLVSSAGAIGATISTSSSAALVLGNTVAVLASAAAAAPITSVTDTCGNTYVNQGAYTGTAASGGWWTTRVTSACTSAITSHHASGAIYSIIAYQIANVTGTVDQYVHVSPGNDTSPVTTGAFTTAQAAEMSLGGVFLLGCTGFNKNTAGYTYDTADGAARAGGMHDAFSSIQTGVTASMTLTACGNTDDSVLVVITIY